MTQLPSTDAGARVSHSGPPCLSRLAALSFVARVRPFCFDPSLEMSSKKRKPTHSLRFDDTQSTAVQSLVPPPELRSQPAAPNDAQLLSEITIHDTEPGSFYIASWRNVLMVRWESAADGSAVERLAKVSTALAAADPQSRRSNVHIITESGGLPTPTARAGFIALMKEHADRLACVAIVVGGTGFWASALRSALTGMRLLAPRSFNYRLHGSVDEVVKWLPAEHHTRTGEQLDSRRLGQVLALWAKSEVRVL